MTIWHRRSISGFSRWTEAKSSSAEDAPEVMEEAAPPPRPISMPGPPRTMMCELVGMIFLMANGARTLPSPPASMIGLW
jgi:hypothetical protein